MRSGDRRRITRRLVLTQTTPAPCICPIECTIKGAQLSFTTLATLGAPPLPLGEGRGEGSPAERESPPSNCPVKDAQLSHANLATFGAPPRPLGEGRGESSPSERESRPGICPAKGAQPSLANLGAFGALPLRPLGEVRGEGSPARTGISTTYVSRRRRPNFPSRTWAPFSDSPFALWERAGVRAVPLNGNLTRYVSHQRRPTFPRESGRLWRTPPRPLGEGRGEGSPAERESRPGMCPIEGAQHSLANLGAFGAQLRTSRRRFAFTRQTFTKIAAGSWPSLCAPVHP